MLVHLHVYCRVEFETISTVHACSGLPVSIATTYTYLTYTQDSKDPKQLLSSANIDLTNLETFALEATTFATEGGLGQVEFETNHRGENDVALFDFTSLFAAQNAARIIERRGKQLLLCLAGDSLINVSGLVETASSM